MALETPEEIKEWLKQNKVAGEVVGAILALGVECSAELLHVTEDDLKTAGMLPAKARALLTKIADAFGSKRAEAPAASWNHQRMADSSWPDPFPGYMGIFSYEVNSEMRSSDQGLGSGVYLWQMEIMPNSFEVAEDADKDGFQAIRCRMRKTLIQLPASASQGMQEWKGKYVIEDWEGEANFEQRAFKLTGILGEAPVESTLDFAGRPLDREALAGTYEMALDEGNETIHAVHASWVEFAGLKADEAIGLLFKMSGRSVCPMLKPSNEGTRGKDGVMVPGELSRKIQEVTQLLEHPNSKPPTQP